MDEGLVRCLIVQDPFGYDTIARRTLPGVDLSVLGECFS